MLAISDSLKLLVVCWNSIYMYVQIALEVHNPRVYIFLSDDAVGSLPSPLQILALARVHTNCHDVHV